MKSEFYNFHTENNSLSFTFQSISDEKTINKIVIYSKVSDFPEIYNLALGDILDNDEVSDLTISNNSDLHKVIATVVQTMLIFFKRYPDNHIYFKGNTPERTRLYRIAISRELNEAKEIFDIYGIIDDILQPFQANHAYESYLVSLKK